MKKSKLLLVSWVLGALYSIYIVVYFFGNTASQSDAASAIGAGLATVLVMPHMICTVLATIFTILGWALCKRGFALTGAILYAVSIALFPLYFFFVVIQMILSFIGYSKMKKSGTGSVGKGNSTETVTE